MDFLVLFYLYFVSSFSSLDLLGRCPGQPGGRPRPLGRSASVREAALLLPAQPVSVGADGHEVGGVQGHGKERGAGRGRRPPRQGHAMLHGKALCHRYMLRGKFSQQPR